MPYDGDESSGRRDCRAERFMASSPCSTLVTRDASDGCTAEPGACPRRRTREPSVHPCSITSAASSANGRLAPWRGIRAHAYIGDMGEIPPDEASEEVAAARVDAEAEAEARHDAEAEAAAELEPEAEGEL